MLEHLSCSAVIFHRNPPHLLWNVRQVTPISIETSRKPMFQPSTYPHASRNSVQKQPSSYTHESQKNNRGSLTRSWVAISTGREQNPGRTARRMAKPCAQYCSLLSTTYRNYPSRREPTSSNCCGAQRRSMNPQIMPPIRCASGAPQCATPALICFPRTMCPP